MWAVPVYATFEVLVALKESLQSETQLSQKTNTIGVGWRAPAVGWPPMRVSQGFCLTQRMPGFWHPFSHEFKAMAYDIAGTGQR